MRVVLIEHNSVKSDIFFNPIFIPCFLGSKFFWVQIYPAPGRSFSLFGASGPGQDLEVVILSVESSRFSTWSKSQHKNVNILRTKKDFKGTLSGLRQCLAIESPLKMMKNAFYFTSKAFFVLKVFKFLSWLFGHVAKQLDLKDKANFKFYGIIAWLKDNCSTHIAQYLEK